MKARSINEITIEIPTNTDENNDTNTNANNTSTRRRRTKQILRRKAKERNTPIIQNNTDNSDDAENSIYQNNEDSIDSMDDEDQQHTIVNRGEDYRNVRCAVCLHEKKMMNENSRSNYKVRRSRNWRPHLQCRAHACTQHRLVVHNYFQQGIILRNYHNEQRINHTRSKK